MYDFAGILHAQVGVKAVMTLTWYSSQSTMLQELFCKGIFNHSYVLVILTKFFDNF